MLSTHLIPNFVFMVLRRISILISFDVIIIVGYSSEILRNCTSLLFVVFYYGKSKCQNTHFLKHDVVMKSFHYLSFLTVLPKIKKAMLSAKCMHVFLAQTITRILQGVLV